MTDKNALPMLLDYRHQLWLNHCNYMLKHLLLPHAQSGYFNEIPSGDNAAILIENRINNQWLFTVLNTLLMCPKNTHLYLVSDSVNQPLAKELLQEKNIEINLKWLSIDDLSPNTVLNDTTSYNLLLKDPYFWQALPQERLLIIQTDALLTEPIPEFFFEFPYLGAPFLPIQQSEYFYRRKANKDIDSFFKVDTPIHGSPDPDVYPHLHGNGGLSIRHKSMMEKICKNHAQGSSSDEQEDVFFSRHISKYCTPAPFQIAQAFAFETSYQRTAIGNHAAWRYISSAELAEHLDKHLRQAWAMLEASN